MFHFGVHRCPLDDRDAGPRGPSEFVMKMDHPVDGMNVRVDRRAPDANELRVSANLGNGEGELDVRYSIDVWLGHAKVYSLQDERARVGANEWFQLCDVDLSGLDGIGEGRGSDLLRVSLNVVPENFVKKSRLPGMLAVQMFSTGGVEVREPAAVVSLHEGPRHIAPGAQEDQ